jgi:hypothetical protein
MVGPKRSLKPVFFIGIFIVMLLLAHEACADDFEVYISVYNPGLGGFSEPFNGRITITSQPMPFHVSVTNTSSSSKKLGKKTQASLESILALELIDEDGRKTVIRKEKEELMSSIESYKYFDPGETRRATIVIDPHKWKNVPMLEPGIVKYFKVRAILETARKKIYSDYYEVTLGGE